MLKFVPLLVALAAAAPVAAQEVAARFVIVSADNGRTIVPQEWSDAIVAEGLGDVTRSVIDTDFNAVATGLQQAEAEGSTLAFFMTANLPTTEDADHARIVETLLTPNPDAPALDGLYAMMQGPGCALIRKPLSGEEFIHTNTILTKNDPEARVACFRLVLRYTIDNLSQFGPRTPFHQQVDPGAAERQAALPPMAIRSQALIDPAAGVAGQPPVRRASNSYKPGEKIDFHANILNVGRLDPGTANARYEIQLDLAVTRKDGSGASELPNVHVYKGQSTHAIPVPDNYFDNFITAGFSLNDPGAYLVELVLTDLTRPNTPGTVLRVPYDVVIAP